MSQSLDHGEVCEVCGFEWDAIDPASIGPRMVGAATVIAAALRAQPTAAVAPSPGRWSSLIYGCHLRDATLNLRDRLVVGLAEDNPVPKAMFTDVRIAAGLYDRETPEVVAGEVEMAAALFARTIEGFTPEMLARPIFYPWPRPETRTLAWVAAQALHEVEHHRDDILANA